MEKELRDETVNEMMENLNLPTGWAMGKEMSTKSLIEQYNTEHLKEEVYQEILKITKVVEFLMEHILEKFDITITHAYIHLDPDMDYHNTMLVSMEDFHSPKLLGAKLMVTETLNREGCGNVRVRFDVEDEVNKVYLDGALIKSYEHIKPHPHIKLTRQSN